MPWINVLMCGHQPTHHYLMTQISNVSGTTSNQLLALLLWDPAWPAPTGMYLFGSTTQFWSMYEMSSFHCNRHFAGQWIISNCNQSTSGPPRLCPTQMPLLSHSRQIWPTSSLLPLQRSALNDIIKRALSSAGFNAVLEPAGLDRGDGKRPDGMTVFPFSRGKCLIWDCTCVDSFSPSAFSLTATEPGSASRLVEVRKNLKYEGLCDRYIFQAIAIKTSYVLGRDTSAFISRLGHSTTSISGERREAEFLRQRLSLETVRGNAKSVTRAGRPSSWIGIALCYLWIALC